MKNFVFAAVAALALTSVTSPALAFSTAHPVITLSPVAPTDVGVSGPHECNAAAAIDGTPFFEMPAIAAEQGVAGIAQVKIDLTSSGRLAGAEMFASSGNRWLDAAALLSARMTRFTSEISNCQHVAGSYLYEVEF